MSVSNNPLYPGLPVRTQRREKAPKSQGQIHVKIDPNDVKAVKQAYEAAKKADQQTNPNNTQPIDLSSMPVTLELRNHEKEKN